MGDYCSGGGTTQSQGHEAARRAASNKPFETILATISNADLCGMLFFLRLQLIIMASVKEQLKPIILKSLRITDLTPDDLRDDQPLLGGELEIDSIDILQLVLEIERHFGIKLVQANFNQKHLESVNALAAIIESKVAEART
jgi:acyl carrier protein